VLEIYASRAAVEIGRASAEAEVRELNLSLERRVRERTSELQAANSELESFSYSISHDLRAPVRAIAGFTGILRERHGNAISDEMQFLFGRIEQNASRMGELIDDLLEFSRTGRAELTRQTLDMRAIVDTVVAGLPQDSVARVAFDVGSLPDCIGDGSMLRQVWENLIGNAVKFSAHVTTPRVQIGGARVPGAVEYYVRDNGAGFDMEYASKLFGVFERLHAASEFEGTGVGLALVRRVVQRHGGKVSAEGAIDKGATFRFSLPD
jgi:light-regulated signal transduction histidine kinase (bacteriophytochrome)